MGSKLTELAGTQDLDEIVKMANDIANICDSYVVKVMSKVISELAADLIEQQNQNTFLSMQLASCEISRKVLKEVLGDQELDPDESDIVLAVA